MLFRSEVFASMEVNPFLYNKLIFLIQHFIMIFLWHDELSLTSDMHLIQSYDTHEKKTLNVFVKKKLTMSENILNAFSNKLLMMNISQK